MQRVINLRTRLVDPHLRELLLGSLAGLIVKVLAALSLFMMNVAVTRSLGATEAGLFFLGLTLVSIVATVGRMGLDQALVRFVATEHSTNSIGRLHAVYRKAICWVMVASIACALLLWSNSSWISKNLFGLIGFEPVLQSMLLATPLVALYIVHAHALQGLKQVSKSMFVLSVALPICILLMLLLVPVQTARNLGTYFIISSAITLLLGLMLWHLSAPKSAATTRFPSELLRKTCMPLWAVAIMHQVIQWSSQLMLGTWGSAEDVAFFATAQRTAMLTSFILFAVNTIAAPKFAAMHAAGDMQGLKRVAQLSVRLMLAAAVPAISIILLFPDWLMSFFGAEFHSASTALVILALGQFVNIATGSVGYLLSMTGNEGKMRDNILVSGVLTVSLGFVLIPGYALLGAAIASATGVALQNLLGVYQVKKQLGFNTLIFWKA